MDHAPVAHPTAALPGWHLEVEQPRTHTLPGAFLGVPLKEGINDAQSPLDHHLYTPNHHAHQQRRRPGAIPVAFSEADQEALPPPDAAALQSAQALPLLTRTASPEAAALVNALAKRIEAREALLGVSVRRGAKLRQKFALAVQAIVGGLLTVAGKRGAEAWTYQPLRPCAFVGQPVGYRQAVSVMRMLTAAPSLVQQVAAHHQFFGGRGDCLDVERRAQRYRASPALLALAEHHGVRLEDSERHWRQERPHQPAKPVIISDLPRRTAGRKLRAGELPLPSGLETEAVLAKVKEANAYLGKFTFGGCDQPLLYRRFTCDFAHHGRWYGGVEHMPTQDRARVTIEGDTVCEVDVHASHLTILHALARRPLPAGDLYGGFSFPRQVVKAWVTACIGNGGPPSRWSSEAKKRAAKQRGARPGLNLSNYRLALVAAEVLARYPFLAHLPALVGAKKEPRLTSHRLMALEAEAVTEAMASLRARGMPSLPIHDALMVRQRDTDVARMALSEAYKRRFGVAAVVQ